MLRIYIGYDDREALAWQVAAASLRRSSRERLTIAPLLLADLRARGLYYRRHRRQDGRLWDLASDAPMATQFANSRFLVPWLAEHAGWALFCDADFYFRDDIAQLFAEADPAKALYCVQHGALAGGGLKMDGQVQTAYPRKNWSSLMLFNCGHPAHRRLTLDMANGLPGRDLHWFCWLEDAEIGALDPRWNHLAGIDAPLADPAAVHFTLGTPDLGGPEIPTWSSAWRAAAAGFGDSED